MNTDKSQLEPETILVRQTSRPIRLCFLIRPTDKAALKQAVQIATSLWGGIYCFILPLISSRPKWWEGPLDKTSASQIIDGYLRVFEPDYLIDLSKEIISTKANFAEYKTWPAHEVIEDNLRGIGLNMLGLYTQMFNTEFQFERKRKVEFILPKVETNSLDLLSAVCLGNFFETGKSKILLEKYREFFEPDVVGIDSTTILKAQASRSFSPINLTAMGLKVTHKWHRVGKCIFFLDPNNVFDLIDFWNLRALGWYCLAMPNTQTDSLDDSSKNILRQFCTGTDWDINVIKGRSINKDQFKHFIDQLAADPSLRIAVSYYPRIWQPKYTGSDNAERCQLSARTKTIILPVKNKMLFFDVLPVGFETDRFYGDTNFINVIQPLYSGITTGFTLNIPREPLAVRGVLGPMGTLNITSINSEGICMLCVRGEQQHHLKLPNSMDLIVEALKPHNLKANISDPGRNCLELLRTIGGLGPVWHLANSGLINILNDLASKSPDTDTSADQNNQNKRKNTKIKIHGSKVNVEHLKTLLKQDCNYKKQDVDLVFQFLTQRGILKIGMDITCSMCHFNNWYTLNTLSDSLICERCLRSFPFPVDSPPRNSWSYRTQGVFSLRNFADGAYTTVLSLRFFADLLRGSGAAMPSFEIKRSNEKIVECDFGIWWRESSSDNFELSLILGESKSFGEFKSKDIAQIKKMSALFPQAFIVFATLKEHLTPKEVKMLRSLALIGRKKWKDGKMENQLIILTGEELLHSIGPPNCWDKREKHYPGIKQSFNFHDFENKLRKLCDITQQLHLGMPTHYDWLSDYYKSRKKSKPPVRT